MITFVTMKDQLIKILTHFNISATRFAEEIGVQRSSISHILSGRNKPSYDFILKVLEKYPGIDPYWLLTGKGTMMGETDSSKPADGEEKAKPEILSGGKEMKSTEDLNKMRSISSNQVDISKQIKDITNVNEIDSIVLLFTNGSFIHYRKAK